MCQASLTIIPYSPHRSQVRVHLDSAVGTDRIYTSPYSSTSPSVPPEGRVLRLSCVCGREERGHMQVMFEN